MRENKYDDPAFFESYSQMPRSVDGLNAAGEWQTFRTMLPDLRDKKVLDLGGRPDHYQAEGLRKTRFLDTDVIKYHRTVATLLNSLLTVGFQLRSVSEPQPSPEILAQYPEMKDEMRRPIFPMMSVVKP